MNAYQKLNALGGRVQNRGIGHGYSACGAGAGHLPRRIQRHDGPSGSALFRCLALGICLIGATVISANAQYVNWNNYSSSYSSGSAQNPEWAEKEFFVALAAHGLAWNSFYGGGGTLAFEYVNSIVHFGSSEF